MIANVLRGNDHTGAFRLMRYLLSPKMETALLADMKRHYRRGERVANSHYDYVLGELPGENVIQTAKRISDELLSWNEQHRRGKDAPKHPFLHVIVSWHPSDEICPTRATELMQSIIGTVMPGDRLSAIVCHADTEHLHCHALVSTICSTGKVWNVHEDFRLWEECVEEMEVLNNFYRVSKRKAFALQDPQREPTTRRPSRGEYQLEKRLRESEIEEHRVMSDRSYLKKSINESLNQTSTLDQFIHKMSEYQIETQVNNAKSGLITGISFLYKGIAWKGSSISKDCGWNKIKLNFKQNLTAICEVELPIQNSSSQPPKRIIEAQIPSKSLLTPSLSNLLSAAKLGEINNSFDLDTTPTIF